MRVSNVYNEYSLLNRYSYQKYQVITRVNSLAANLQNAASPLISNLKMGSIEKALPGLSGLGIHQLSLASRHSLRVDRLAVIYASHVIWPAAVISASHVTCASRVIWPVAVICRRILLRAESNNKYQRSEITINYARQRK